MYGKIFFFIILTLIFIIVVRQMLCLFVSMADVIAWQMSYALLKLWQMLLPRGRCYPLNLWVADVIANFAWHEEKYFPIHLFGITKLCMKTFSTDLRKPCCNLAKACLLSIKLVLILRKSTYYTLIITSGLIFYILTSLSMFCLVNSMCNHRF